MSRQRILLLSVVVAAVLLACAWAVWTQEPEERARQSSPSQQPTEGKAIPGRYIVVLKEDGARRTGEQLQGDLREFPEAIREAQRVATDLRQENKVENITQTYGASINGFAAKIPAEKVGAVRSDPRVAFVAQDREVRATAQTLPTGVNRVDADLDTNSVDVGNEIGTVDADIAILDSGIYTEHPDLNIAGGKDCTAMDGNNTFSDNHGHGSHVAGIAAAKDDSGGVVGTAPGARLWAVKVLEDFDLTGYESELICGIDWVTKNSSTIEVVNMSLEIPPNRTGDDGECDQSNSDTLHQVICTSVAAGVTYVVSAGNDGSSVGNYVPASYDEVITVSALADYDGLPSAAAGRFCKPDSELDAAKDDRFATFSNLGEDVDIGAPGVCIKSTWKAVKKDESMVPGYKTVSGTSMASPHVAGAAAVYLANTNPNATPLRVRRFLIAAANSEAGGSGHFDRRGKHPEPILQMDNY